MTTNNIELAGPTSLASYSATPLTINLNVCIASSPTICYATSFVANIGYPIQTQKTPITANSSITAVFDNNPPTMNASQTVKLAKLGGGGTNA